MENGLCSKEGDSLPSRTGERFLNIKQKYPVGRKLWIRERTGGQTVRF